MLPFRRLARQTLAQFAVALVASASWLSGCGDDESTFGKGKGKGGSGGTAGNAGAATGGTLAGSGGTPMAGSGGGPTGGSGGSGGGGGGSGGAPTGGNGGSMAGNAGSAGTGTGGNDGMGGEGGVGMGGEGGVGPGGQGGAPDGMCTTADLGITLVSAAPMQAHDHLPINGMARTTLLNSINSGMPLTFTLPTDGTNPHNHTLTFTALELTVLRNGGALAMNVTSSVGGPVGNMHTHTYSLECQP